MRFQRLILGLALLLSHGNGARAQNPIWAQLPNSPSGTTPRNDDIYFVNNSTGLVARSTSGIYKTTDGGNTWVQKVTMGTTHFRCISFATETHGWAGNLGPGSYDGAVTDTNVMYETFDGGETWTNHPGFAEAGMKGLCAFYVLDAQHIYGGGRVRGPAYFIKSVNGGTNWSITNLTAAGVMGGIMDIYFRDPTNGFVVGMNTNTYADSCASTYYGRIARTTDGGATWQPMATTTIPCCYFWKMAWPTTNTGYVSLQQNASGNTFIFYKTTDGGASWVSNGIPYSTIGISSFYWQGIGFVSANEGWAGGDSSTSPYANNFLHTIDGGATWTPAGYNNSERINRIRFLSPTLAYAAGAKLNVYRVPLAIINQPQNQWVSPGVTISLTVGVTGNPPFTYQWTRNGAAISGATNSSLALTNVSRAQAATYAVQVTNTYLSLVSSNAVVRVVSPEFINNPQLVGGTNVRIVFGDPVGGALGSNDLSNFQVLASSNLVQWDVLTNGLTVTNGMLQFLDSGAYPRRFYRVLEH